MSHAKRRFSLSAKNDILTSVLLGTLASTWSGSFRGLAYAQSMSADMPSNLLVVALSSCSPSALGVVFGCLALFLAYRTQRFTTSAIARIAFATAFVWEGLAFLCILYYIPILRALVQFGGAASGTILLVIALMQLIVRDQRSFLLLAIGACPVASITDNLLFAGSGVASNPSTAFLLGLIILVCMAVLYRRTLNLSEEPHGALQPTKSAIVPWPLLVHLLSYGIGFGILGSLTFSQEFVGGKSWAMPALCVGGVLAVILSVQLFRRSIDINLLWTQIVGVVAPVTFAGIALMSPPEMEIVAAAVTQGAAIYYEIIMLMGAYVALRETGFSADEVIVFGQGVLTAGFSVGSTVGALLAKGGLIFDGSGMLPSAHTALIVAFILLFTLATTWLGPSDSVRKWWGSRVELSPKQYAEEATKARCQYLRIQFGLSSRETEVAELIMQGKKAPAIARDLFISPSTVRNHINHIYEKTGVHSHDDLRDLARDMPAYD